MLFSVVDLVFIVIIAIITLVSTAKGFVKAIFGKLCWILGLLGAFFFYNKLNVFMSKNIKNGTLSIIVSFVLIFVVIFLIVKIIQLIVAKFFEGEIMKGLDRALGFLFGLVEGLAVVFLIIFIITNQPIVEVNNLFEGSFFYKLLAGFLPQAAAMLPKEIA